MKIGFQVKIKIQKNVSTVFEAVYSPEKLSGYFTNGGASAPLIAGTTVEWAFADSPGKRIAFPVYVVESIENRSITIDWQGRSDGGNTRVEMGFEADDEGSTVVRISETGWDEKQDDLARSYDNCMGWSQMLSALKAFVEYDINLRKGAYEGLY